MNFEQEFEEQVRSLGDAITFLYRENCISREEYDELIDKLREIGKVVEKYRFDQ